MTVTLNTYKDYTQALCEKKGWDKSSVNTVWLLLTEEIGELASAIRQNSRTFSKTGLRKNRGIDVQMEMGDVFSYLFQLAFMLNVDLDEMWLKHQTKVVTRKYNNRINISNDVQ
jgi:NTP pyrophosphatase (non-canonical NTP hydrolase)